jgi:hypothetical protein
MGYVVVDVGPPAVWACDEAAVFRCRLLRGSSSVFILSHRQLLFVSLLSGVYW